MKCSCKCKRNHFVLINRRAQVGLGIWILALNFGEILREFGDILGKYRRLDGRSVGSIGLNLTGVKGKTQHILIRNVLIPYDFPKFSKNMYGCQTYISVVPTFLISL